MISKNQNGGRDSGQSRADEYRGHSIGRSPSGSRAAQGKAQSAGQGGARKPSPSSAAKKSAPKAAAQKPAASKPAASKPAASKPAPKQGSAKPAPKQGAAKPASKQGTAKPASKQASKPRMSAAKPAQAKRPARNTKSAAPGRAAQKPAAAAGKAVKGAPAAGARRDSGRDKSAGVAAERANSARTGSAKHGAVTDAERLEQKKKQRQLNLNQKFYSVLYFVSIALFVICAMGVLSMSVLFHIKEIVVETDGELPYSEEEIIEASGISVGNNLLSISRLKAEENIPFTLPYIENAEVVRELPSTVHIKVECAVPMGLVLNTEKQLVVVSTGGRALEVLRGNNPDHIPVINGLLINKSVLGCKVEFEKPEQFETALKIVNIFRQYDLEPDSVSFSPTGNTVSAVYDQRINMRLGTVAGLEEKIELAATLIRKDKISPGEAGTLDLTIRGRGIFRPDYVEQENAMQLSSVYEKPQESEYELLEVRREEAEQTVSDSSAWTP